MTRATLIPSILSSILICGFAGDAEAKVLFSGDKKLNNLVSELLEVASISKSSSSFTFTRSRDGWIFIAAGYQGEGAVRILLDNASRSDAVIVRDADGGMLGEGMRYVTKGKHTLHVECKGKIRVEKLVVKAIPELMHCGLGFNSSIKSYPTYDMAFLKKDILPNANILLVPHNIQLPQSVIDDWHREGKWFVAEVGKNAQGKAADENFEFYANFFKAAHFLDGLIINEFGMNRPSGGSNPERQSQAAKRHQPYEDAFKKLRADERYKDKVVYVYFGGSGNVVNYDDTGTTFVRTLIDLKYPIALERYIFERSSQEKSKDALQAFIDGIADWEEKEPGVKKQMVIAFGLFSMPPGGINKVPGVDYHVWMDQQMNVVAQHPVMSDLRGLNWWTSTLADEETVRWVGKLYRHYAIDGHTNLLTKPDPLFLSHIQNADFEKGSEGWTLNAAETGTIEPRSHPRYGRIEGRYMGLGRPADPEHIGDTFLWMKRSEKRPNTFSQTIRNLDPGRLYSLKMFSCDYNDLINPKAKKLEEASQFTGTVDIESVDIDGKRSFAEMYASNPEPRIPVWITYHWKVFRARGTTARLIVSDWPKGNEPGASFGLEQTFNFLEIQPYRE